MSECKYTELVELSEGDRLVNSGHEVGRHSVEYDCITMVTHVVND